MSARPVVPMVAAGMLGAIGAFMLLGIVTPFAAGEGFSLALSEGNGQLVVLIGIAALLCIGGCVGEFLHLREGLLVGIGVAAGFAPTAGAALVSIVALSDLTPHVGFVLWGIAALLGLAVVVLLFIDVLRTSDRAPVPMVFSACCLGAGLLLTAGLLIPASGVPFSDHIGSVNAIFAGMNLLYAVVPLLVGVAALASPRRSTLTLTLGVVAWYATAWTVAATSRSAIDFGNFPDPGLAYYVQSIALTVLGLSAVGGGLVRWANGSPQVRSVREYALPITACSTLVLMLLVGLVVGG